MLPTISSATLGLLFNWRNITWQRVDLGWRERVLMLLLSVRHRNLKRLGFVCVPSGLVAQFLFNMFY